MSSASGGLRPPDPLPRGFAPGPHWGLCPQTPDIGSLSALAMESPLAVTFPAPNYWSLDKTLRHVDQLQHVDHVQYLNQLHHTNHTEILKQLQHVSHVDHVRHVNQLRQHVNHVQHEHEPHRACEPVTTCEMNQVQHGTRQPVTAFESHKACEPCNYNMWSSFNM